MCLEVKQVGIVGISSALLLSGCALMEIKDDIRAREHHISEQNAKLNDLKAEQEQMRIAKESLLTELESSRLTVEELWSRLESIKRQNQQLTTLTKSQMKQKAEFNKTLEQMQLRLEHVAQESSSIEEKKKLIKDLRLKIRAHLEIQAKEEPEYIN